MVLAKPLIEDVVRGPKAIGNGPVHAVLMSCCHRYLSHRYLRPERLGQIGRLIVDIELVTMSSHVGLRVCDGDARILIRLSCAHSSHLNRVRHVIAAVSLS
jgi:hypothetical protein